jgi:phenylalanyl-tRNA synthetase alpha chain
VELNLDQIDADARAELKAAGSDPEAIQALNVKYLGRKGILTQFLRSIAGLPPGQRPAAGQKANEIKQGLGAAIGAALQAIEQTSPSAGDRIDVSLPGRMEPWGALHPITRVSGEICDILSKMGFDIVEGPEVEKDYYNFEALNIPKNHPARDMQDTFFVSADVVLRTHTSPLQIRTMERQPPPVRVIAPGKVFRCDSDQTHTPMFHQVEGLLVDENVSFGDLKGTLTAFVHQMFDEQTRLRFRAPRWTSCASSAGARAAGSASTPVGWKSSARAWCTRPSSKMWATTPSVTPASLSAWVSSGLPC